MPPGSPATMLIVGGSGGAGGAASFGRAPEVKQKRRASMKAFSCCVLRDVVRHTERQ